MLKNYIKTAVRVFRRQKSFSAINITGLAIGLACCILILLWVADELNYDRYHENADRLYRITSSSGSESADEWSATTPAPLSAALKEEFPDVILSTRVNIEGSQLINYEDRSFQSEVLAIADPDFLQMFSFPLLQGNPQTALEDWFSVVISQDMSIRYFGDEDPIGRVITMDQRDFTVTGVFAGVPHNSHLQFDLIAPFESRGEYLKSLTDRWDVSAYYNYVKLSPETDASAFEDVISGYMQRLQPGVESSLKLQSISSIHLQTGVTDYLEGHGEIRFVYLFSALAVLILIIACINFLNLTTARSGSRTKEVGVRKMLGASKSDLIRQFFGESILFSVIGMLLAIAIVEMALPAFSSWSAKPLDLDYTRNGLTLLVLAGAILLVGVVAGTYPAYFLSSFQPARVLKGNRIGDGRGGGLRRLLVFTQFTMAIVLIGSATVIHQQMDFIRATDLGFDPENVLTVQMRGDFRANYRVLREELEADPAIVSVTAGRSPARVYQSAASPEWEGKNPDEEVMMRQVAVEPEYLDFYRMKVVEGRGFSRKPTDENYAFVINQTAARLIGSDNIVGKEFSFRTWNGEYFNHAGTVIGVVQDFHNGSLHGVIAPVIMYVDPDALYQMNVRTEPGRAQDVIARLEAEWERLTPDRAFNYSFVDESIQSFYTSEKHLSTLFDWFTALAIFVSCLGLFGLASFATERRTKEIGVRKVLGANVSDILTLLSKEVLAIVMLAGLFAVPIAIYLMSNWLDNFAYRVDVGYELMIGSVLAVLVVSLATISLQTLRAAMTNPVDSLRHE